jgi:hypothetical protein
MKDKTASPPSKRRIKTRALKFKDTLIILRVVILLLIKDVKQMWKIKSLKLV